MNFKENTLDLDKKSFDKLLKDTIDVVDYIYKNIDRDSYCCVEEPKNLEKIFDEKLPVKETDYRKIFETIVKKIHPNTTNNLGSKYFAYVMSGGNHISMVADFIASALNQNVAKWHSAPSMIEIEKRVIKWTGKLIGFNENASGVLVTGGSAANMACITIARNMFFEKLNLRENGLFNAKPMRIYCSDQTHSCVRKSVECIGIGSNNLVEIGVDKEYKIDLKELIFKIEEDIKYGYVPFCIVGNAGTVNTGSIDELNKLSEIAKKYNLWFHIDGSYGGLIAGLKSHKKYYKGIEKADSIALDYHKWLYQQFEVGGFLVRDWSLLKKSFYYEAEYLKGYSEKERNRFNFNDHYFQLSKNAKSFKIWTSLKVFGIEKIQKMMTKDLRLTQHIYEVISTKNDFQILNKPKLSALCFRYFNSNFNDKKLNEINKNIIYEFENDGEYFVTGTVLNSQYVIRTCLVNHRIQKENVDNFFIKLEKIKKLVLDKFMVNI